MKPSGCRPGSIFKAFPLDVLSSTLLISLKSMGNKSLAQQQLEEFDKVFKALAHPTRRHILVVLMSRNDKMPAGEIVDAFDYTWPTITRHLHQLEEAGLISVTKMGTQNLYSFNRQLMTSVLENWLKWFK